MGSNIWLGKKEERNIRLSSRLLHFNLNRTRMSVTTFTATWSLLRRFTLYLQCKPCGGATGKFILSPKAWDAGLSVTVKDAERSGHDDIVLNGVWRSCFLNGISITESEREHQHEETWTEAQSSHRTAVDNSDKTKGREFPQTQGKYKHYETLSATRDNECLYNILQSSNICWQISVWTKVPGGLMESHH